MGHSLGSAFLFICLFFPDTESGLPRSVGTGVSLEAAERVEAGGRGEAREEDIGLG